MSNTAFNPYAAPAAPVEDVAANAEAEAIRKAHISHEASVKAVGILYYLGGLGVTLASLGALFTTRQDALGLGASVGLLAIGVGQFFAGYGVRALRPWGRNVGCVLSALGLIGFPIGTLINAYILYLFLSKKGRMIYSPEYQDVIAATPHIKYRTSIVVWILLALVVALVALAFLAPMLGGK